MDKIALTNKYWDAYNKHDIEGLIALLDDTVEIYGPANGHTKPDSKESMRANWSMMFGAVVPNSHYEVVSMVTQGDTVACQTIETGNCTIPAGMVPVEITNKPFKVPHAFFMRFNDAGLITQIYTYWDLGIFCEQTGVDIALLRGMQADAS